MPTNVRNAAFNELSEKLKQHVKVKHIKYHNLKNVQNYLTSGELCNEDCSLLFNLRCRTVKSIKDNFHRLHENDLQCDVCKTGVDSQEHILECQGLDPYIHRGHVKYEDIFGTIMKQKAITILYSRLLEERDRILEAYRGNISTGPTNINVF